MFCFSRLLVEKFEKDKFLGSKLNLKNTLFVVILFSGLSVCKAQENIDEKPINNIKLLETSAAYSGDVYLWTGDEAFFKKYKWQGENIKANLKKGIQEGLYEGNILNYVKGFKAHKMTFHFYQDTLYMIRWFFDDQYDDVKIIESGLKEFLKDTYGYPIAQTWSMLNVWERDKTHLQLFVEPAELQIEYRNKRIHEKVESIR